MAEFLFKNEADILEDIRQQLADSETPVTDWEIGSANRTFWEVVAKIAANQQYMLERLLNLFFIDNDELTDGDLDKRGYERNLSRKIGSQSSGFLILSRSTPSPYGIFIPTGTTFRTFDQEVTIETIEDALISTGQTQVSVKVKASEIGSKGNLSANTELTQSGVAIIGVETIKVDSNGLSGGTDTETDEEFRARLLDIIRNPENGGSVRDYIRWAKEIPGVLSASCIETARGPGTTDVIIVSTEGVPSEDLLKTVQAHIELKRPTNADVLVRGPESYPISFSITYWTDSVSPFEDTIKKALQNYIANLGVGGTVRISQIYNVIMDISEIKDMTLISPTQNIVLSQNQIAEIKNIEIIKGT